MYKLTQDPNLVANTDTNEIIPNGNPKWDEYQQWIAEGNTPIALPVPTLQDIAKLLTVDVQAYIDAPAIANGYDSMAQCCTYAGCEIQQYEDDATAGNKFRAKTWEQCFQIQAQMLANPPAFPPTSEQLIAMLPKPEDFGWVVHAPGAA